MAGKKGKKQPKTEDGQQERWTLCMACGQPRGWHTDEEAVNGCKREGVNVGR